MRTLSSKVFRFCAIAACSAIVASGCMLDRRPIVSPGTLVPAEYCAGDTLTASYDFLRFAGGTCTPRAGSPDECTTAAPTTTITSVPEAFAPVTRQAYANSVDFTTSADRIDVNFAYGTGSIFVPPSTLLVNVRDHTVGANRIRGVITTDLIHPGICAGATPMNEPAELPLPPRVSRNLRLVDVCNTNGVVVVVTLSGSASGVTHSQMLTPGSCIDTSEPGVPAGIDSATIVEVRPLVLDPTTRCTATGPNNPPASLRSVAHTQCR